MVSDENSKVLIAYATKYGATAEIAAKIGQVLGQSGLPVEVRPVREVKDLTPYPAVILGSAVYIGRWRKEAVRFLKRKEQPLAERDAWLFSSGPTGEGDPTELLDGWEMPGQIQPSVDRIQPRDVTLFHGSLDVDKVNVIERSMIKNVKAPVGDFRDWQTITSWAATFADFLNQPVSLPPVV